MEVSTTSQTLCLSCGFCCDGTLFNSVPVGPADEWAPLQAAGIRIRTTGQKPCFPQPCAAHQRGSCQVYENRPANCRTYRCELLKKYERGDVSWHDAQERIGRVKALKDSLATEFGRIIPEGGPWPASIVSSLVPALPEFGADRELLKTWAPVLLLMAAMRHTLERHFRRPRKEEDQPGGNAPISREAAS